MLKPKPSVFPWCEHFMLFQSRNTYSICLPILNHYKVGFLPFFPPPSCQSNFLILNISAKSSQIFTKFSGELSVGVPLWLKQKGNKSINKKTNKQTNKHFRTYISQPNQVQSSWNFQDIFLWVSLED